MGLSDIPAEEVTIAKLLMRLRTSEGEILIDGQDIRKITQDDLRKYSYISQNLFCFTGRQG